MFPFAQDVMRFLIGFMHSKVGLRQVQIFALNLQRRHGSPITNVRGTDISGYCEISCKARIGSLRENPW